MGKFLRQIGNLIRNYEGLVTILILVTILRIPSLYEPNRYADEDIYLTLGMAFRKGLVFYRDIHDNKPPFLYLIAALAGGVTYFRLILMGWNLINTVFVFVVAQKMKLKRLVVLAVTLFFGIFSSIPLTEGNIANGEVFMILPTTIAIWLLLTTRKREKTVSKFYLVGTLLAMGFLFKIPVVFELIAILFWLTVYQAKTAKMFLKSLFSKKVWFVVIGFTLPIIISIVYYVFAGAGESYIKAALLQNVGYISSWEGESKPIYQSELFTRGIIWLAIMGLITLFRRGLKLNFGLMSLWFSGALFGALLSGRPYPHYLIEIVAPIGLMLGLLINKFNLPKGVITLVLVGALGGSIVYYKFWYYQTIPYYQNFLEYQFLGKSEKDYRDFFGYGVNRNYEIAQYLRGRTTPEEKIFVWGTEPAIYVLANRLPVGKYTVAYHVADFNGQVETYQALLEERPHFIVKIKNEEVLFDQLQSLLEVFYINVKEINGAEIWRRR